MTNRTALRQLRILEKIDNLEREQREEQKTILIKINSLYLKFFNLKQKVKSNSALSFFNEATLNIYNGMEELGTYIKIEEKGGLKE